MNYEKLFNTKVAWFKGDKIWYINFVDFEIAKVILIFFITKPKSIKFQVKKKVLNHIHILKIGQGDILLTIICLEDEIYISSVQVT